jgi:hypothetical protein
MSAITILEQWVDVYGSPDIVKSTKIYSLRYLTVVAIHAADDVFGKGRTVLEGSRGGRED